MIENEIFDVIIVGGGFTGMTAAYNISKQGYKILLIEGDAELGGLASAFDVGGEKLDRFYHHIFTSDTDIINLINKLEMSQILLENPTNTGVYYANNFYKLSSPLDVLKFKPLSLFDRFKLGLMVLKARKVKHWEELENLTAYEWLIKLGGINVFKIIWEPLLNGKFGPYAKDISAVWFWNKLKLRGGSRSKSGDEKLIYLKGGFIKIIERLSKEIKKKAGKIILSTYVSEINKKNNIWEVKTKDKIYNSRSVLITTALPIFSKFIEKWANKNYLDLINRINYIGNVCLVLELKYSLSKTYWLNVNDPSFPFVGVIEHTNLESTESYKGKHIVYLSKYIPTNEKIFNYNKDEYFEYAFPYLKKMFPEFEIDWVINYHIWKAEYSQPIVEKNYSKYIPSKLGPESGLYISTMAQIYPEDRGTNYAIRSADEISKIIINDL